MAIKTTEEKSKSKNWMKSGQAILSVSYYMVFYHESGIVFKHIHIQQLSVFFPLRLSIGMRSLYFSLIATVLRYVWFSLQVERATIPF